ncbi:MAG TPA: extracellular solute-binding protein [Clostridiaceae bacterium]|nr:extracellular solute-binding protein [Clostridiaceae bacterium]
MSKILRVLSVMLCIILVLSLSACGSKSKDTTSGNTDNNQQSQQTEDKKEENQNKGPVKLKLLTISSDESRQRIMDEYIKPNVGKVLPHVEIEYEGTANVADKMKVYNSSGDLPDVWYSGADFALPIINAGNQLDLEPYMKEDGYLEKFKIKDALYFRGKIYAISSGADAYFNPRIFYHKDIFASNNIEVPTTFDEFVEVCKKLVNAGIQPIATPGKGGWAPGFFLLQNMIMIEDPEVAQQIVDNKTDFANPVIKNAADRIVQLAKIGAFGQGAANLDYGPAKELFVQNKAAMYMMMTWELPDLEANVPDLDFFLWPKASDKFDPNKVVQYWGSPLAGYAVYSKSANLEDAIKLAEFCCEQDALFFESTGSLISFNTGNQMAELKPIQKKNVEHFENTTTRIATYHLNALDTKCATEHSNLGANLMTGDYSAEQFVEDFNKVWLENTWFD